MPCFDYLRRPRRAARKAGAPASSLSTSKWAGRRRSRFQYQSYEASVLSAEVPADPNVWTSRHCRIFLEQQSLPALALAFEQQQLNGLHFLTLTPISIAQLGGAGNEDDSARIMALVQEMNEKASAAVLDHAVLESFKDVSTLSSQEEAAADRTNSSPLTEHDANEEASNDASPLADHETAPDARNPRTISLSLAGPISSTSTDDVPDADGEPSAEDNRVSSTEDDIGGHITGERREEKETEGEVLPSRDPTFEPRSRKSLAGRLLSLSPLKRQSSAPTPGNLEAAQHLVTNADILSNNPSLAALADPLLLRKRSTSRVVLSDNFGSYSPSPSSSPFLSRRNNPTPNRTKSQSSAPHLSNGRKEYTRSQSLDETRASREASTRTRTSSATSHHQLGDCADVERTSSPAPSLSVVPLSLRQQSGPRPASEEALTHKVVEERENASFAFGFGDLNDDVVEDTDADAATIPGQPNDGVENELLLHKQMLIGDTGFSLDGTSPAKKSLSDQDIPQRVLQEHAEDVQRRGSTKASQATMAATMWFDDPSIMKRVPARRQHDQAGETADALNAAAPSEDDITGFGDHEEEVVVVEAALSDESKEVAISEEELSEKVHSKPRKSLRTSIDVSDGFVVGDAQGTFSDVVENEGSFGSTHSLHKVTSTLGSATSIHTGSSTRLDAGHHLARAGRATSSSDADIPSAVASDFNQDGDNYLASDLHHTRHDSGSSNGSKHRGKESGFRSLRKRAGRAVRSILDNGRVNGIFHSGHADDKAHDSKNSLHDSMPAELKAGPHADPTFSAMTTYSGTQSDVQASLMF